MKTFCHRASLCACLVLLSVSVYADFWYDARGPVPLTVDSNKITVRFEEGISSDDQQFVLARFPRVTALLPDSNVFDGFVVCSLSTSQGYGAFLDSLVATPELQLAEPYYLNEWGDPNLVGSSIAVAFERTTTSQEIDSLRSLYGLLAGDSILFGLYYLENSGSTGMRTLDIANSLRESALTRYAHPNFLVRLQTNGYTVYDYYQDYEYHIKRVVGELGIASVWDFAGVDHPVVVAVLDKGVEPHEDLPDERVLRGSDFYDKDTISAPGPFEYHGMACAGIIAASHTLDSSQQGNPNTGVLSMNPNAQILPIKIFSDYGATNIPREDLVAAIKWAADNPNTAVVSNSWSWRYLDGEPADITDVLTWAYENGRYGLGCPVIFSAGNSGEYESQVSYPARIPACFAVGAIDTFDVRFPYSQYAADSPEVDIVTYSSVLGMQSDFWSIDQMGEFGANVAYKNPRFPDYLWDCGPEGNDLDYNCHFAGTSAACAVVAGAASLLIAKDSFLTAEEVYTILRGSAVRELAWNGGLPIDTPNNEYGYGRVDAFRAVLSISHGDVTNDGEIDMADITFLIDWIYRAGPTPFPSPDLGDIDCDGVATISDITKLISYVYIDGPPPVKPCFKYGLPAK